MSDDVEQRLKNDLERVAAPEGFADRVMERVRMQEHGRLHLMPSRIHHVWRAVAAVALIAVVLGGVETVHRRQQERRAEVIQRQFELAMEITQRTLNGVGERISEAGVKYDKGER